MSIFKSGKFGSFAWSFLLQLVLRGRVSLVESLHKELHRENETNVLFILPPCFLGQVTLNIYTRQKGICMLRLIRKILPVLSYQDVKKEIEKQLRYSSVEHVEKWTKRQVKLGRATQYDVEYAFFSILKDSQFDVAIKYGKKALEKKHNNSLENALQTRLNRNKRTNNQYSDYYSIKNFQHQAKLNNLEEVEKWMKESLVIGGSSKVSLYKGFFSFYKDLRPIIAIYYGEQAVTFGVGENFTRVVNNRYARLRKALQTINDEQAFLHDIKLLIESNRVDFAFKVFNLIKDTGTKERLAKKIFSIYKDSHTKTACLFISPELNLISDFSYLKVIAARMYAINNMEQASILYSRCLESDQSKVIHERFVLSYVAAHQAEILKEYKHHFTVKPMIAAVLPNDLEISIIDDTAMWVTYLSLKNEDAYSPVALECAEHLVARGYKKVALELSKSYFAQGHIAKALRESSLDSSVDAHNQQSELLKGYQSLLQNGFPMPSSTLSHQGIENKALYTLYNSLPVHSAGYATRAHGLMLELRKHGFDFSAMTRRGYPQDLRKFRDRDVCEVEYVDGIAYHRLPTETEGHGFIPLDEYLTKYAQHIIEHAKANNVGVLHSASNFVNGVATNYAAKALGIKSIYEVRGLWEVTRMSRQPEWEGTEHYEMTKRLETESALYADQVITITQALKDEMVRRGVDGDKITVVPNGVDTSRFEILPRDQALEEKLQLQDQMVIGYVGSMVDYEGLDLLVHAAANLKAKGLTGFKLLMVGDGIVKPELEAMVEENDLQDIVIFTGRVPHDEVESYYSLIDICPFPRKALPVCEMVSPLKPFEAMAMGKAVVSSNVAALAEIVQDGVTGLLHEKDCANDLADKLQAMIENPSLREVYGQAAREWVVAERDWKVLAKRVEGVYKKLQQQSVNEKAT